MAFLFSSRSKDLEIIQLNSGKKVFLAPGASSGIFEDLEITDNEKVAKLLKMNLIRITKVETIKKPEVIMSRKPKKEPKKRQDEKIKKRVS